jgi:hypothetical protein
MRRIHHKELTRYLAYLWVSPVTAFALGLVVVGVATGGRARIVRGVVEVHGGWIGRYLRHGMPWFGPAAAMTLGHVILGRDAECLAASRDHEHVHVRQYERWGLLFIPAYLSASLWCWLRGYDAYFDNPFERDAYDAESQRSAG